MVILQCCYMQRAHSYKYASPSTHLFCLFLLLHVCLFLLMYMCTFYIIPVIHLKSFTSRRTTLFIDLERRSCLRSYRFYDFIFYLSAVLGLRLEYQRHCDLYSVNCRFVTTQNPYPYAIILYECSC